MRARENEHKAPEQLSDDDLSLIICEIETAVLLLVLSLTTKPNPLDFL